MSGQNSQQPNRGQSSFPSDSQVYSKSGGSQNPNASGVRHRTRAERVAAHFTYYGLLQQIFDALQNVEMRKQITMVVLATLAMCIATQSWNPPFPFVEYEVPERAIVCRIAFTFREEKPQHHFQHNTYLPGQLLPVQTVLETAPSHLSEEEILNSKPSPAVVVPETPPGQETTLQSPMSGDSTPLPSSEARAPETTAERSPAAGVAAAVGMTNESDILAIEAVLNAENTRSLETASGLDGLSEASIADKTNHTSTANGNTSQRTPANHRKFAESSSSGNEPVLIEDELPGQLAISKNGERVRVFVPGTVLVEAGQMITRRDIQILQTEFSEFMAQRSFAEKISRFFGVFFLTLALFLLAFIFLRRRERRRPKSPYGMVFLYILMIGTVIGTVMLHESVQNGANLELVPILLFAQGIAVAFSWELALILTVIISFVFVLSQANSLFTMVLLIGVTASVVIHLGRLRSRTKLIVVGSFGALVAFLLTLFIEMVKGGDITRVVLTYAVLNAFWTCTAAFLMTGLLPFIERPCGILTDMSLLELGDPSHPLLHELTRRAPATYSHSLQVASIAETAAESIGARGLLVRVGAYFHDIGKILNPEYFTENQQVGQNIHDSLEPRVSTLVIVAHVKDGADLVRQHRVPKPVIDLVEQHHGTSLVSFFHSLATRQNRDQGYSTTIDEGSFRYPGPKPQSKEAGILMLADAAESACRSLKEAAPNKIEAMVRHISEDKLKDGQFDESGLTLQELRTIENSIINSILAMRHNRISYPDRNIRKTQDSAETSQAQEASR